MIPSLVLLLVLAPEPCAPADLACTAREQIREARKATDPRERAQALLTAARAHLALYRKTGSPAELCAARRLVPQRHTSDLGDLPRTTRAEVEAELARLKHDCTPPRASMSAAATPPQPVASPTSAPSSTATSAIALDPVEPSAPDAEVLLDVGSRPIDVVRPVAAKEPGAPTAAPASARRMPSARPADIGRPAVVRPGRGLLIAGGLSLASASVLAGVTAHAALRVERARGKHDELAQAANTQGYTSPDVGVMRRELETEARHWRRVMIGTSIATAVVTGAAVALLTSGAVKRRRAPGRFALHPVLPGLLLTARF